MPVDAAWGSRGWGRPKWTSTSQPRFWMPKGAVGRRVIILTDPPFTFYEHVLPDEEGKYRVRLTCVRRIHKQGCPLCEFVDEEGKPKFRGSFGAAFTVIDRHEWTGRDGKTHSDSRRLMVAGDQTLKLLEIEAKQQGGLAGCEFKVSRSTAQKAAAVGDKWDFDRKWSRRELVTELGEEKIREFDYATMLAPKSYEELASVVSQYGGGNDSFDNDDPDSFNVDEFASKSEEEVPYD